MFQIRPPEKIAGDYQRPSRFPAGDGSERIEPKNLRHCASRGQWNRGCTISRDFFLQITDKTAGLLCLTSEGDSLFRKTFGREEVEQSYREYAAALIVFASAILRDRARAQDVVQQVFLRLMDRPVEVPENPKAYLFAAVRNTALNESRSGSRRVEFEENDPWFETPISNGEGVDIMTERSLRRGLCSLPEEQRQVVVMHLWGELTFAAIADVLGISAHTAASRYRYAVARLREHMTTRKGKPDANCG